MGDNIAQIKDRLNVVDVISGYIKVQKSGVNFKARCPFHNEKTPSFYISPERQIWHCFGCGVGGDIFGFIKQMEGVEFGEALRILAQKAGITLERYDQAAQDAKTVLYDICETAARFFEKQLYHSSVGKTALDYLLNRGLTGETIKEFRLGFAPDDWHALGKFLRDCGYKEEDIIGAGLAIKRQNIDQAQNLKLTSQNSYDRFRSRIIFPVADLNDRIVGFTGRIFGVENSAGHQPSTGNENQESAPAKYINTPQTAIYDKSRILYGLNMAKLEVRRSDRCLLVEGNIDVIMSYQAGVKNTAGTSGTALTPSHLQLLQRYAKNLDLCFDADQAGLTATRRGIGLALGRDFNIRIVSLSDPNLKDPADYVKKFGGLWQETVKKAKPAVDFYFDKLCSDLDLSSVSGKKQMIHAIGPLVNRLVSGVEKSHWVSKVAAVLKTKESVVEADMASVKDDLDVYESSNLREPDIQRRASVDPTPEDLLSQALLAVILKNPPLFKTELLKINLESIDPALRPILANLCEDVSDDFKLSSFIKKFGESESMKIEFANLRSQEALKDFSDHDLMDEFTDIKSKIERRTVTATLAEIELEIKAAEAVGDNVKIGRLLSEFNSNAKKLNS